MSFFIDNMIADRENPKVSIKKIQKNLELTVEFIKVTEYKIKIQFFFFISIEW